MTRDETIQAALRDCLAKLAKDPGADELCDRLVLLSEAAPWVWMPHPAHLIVARDCRFHLATCVGNWIVSTVGEYLPDEASREIICDAEGITLSGRGDARLASFLTKHGYVEIGAGRKFETMVFPAKKNADPEHQCCAFVPADYGEVDFRGYNDKADAYAGHLELCEKW